jgi:large subunit ribosomal protein L5
LVETVENTLLRITGQRPAKTAAKKSISNFKIRKGMTVGFMVTLRGHRMYDFLDKLVNLTLPRVRDFRGLPRKSVDHKGNLSIGFREHVAFPEIRPDEVERLHGLGITVVTNAKSREKGLALFAGLGFPFAAK